MIERSALSAVILAGGEGRRMGGADKGWLDYRGRPLIAHVIDRLQPQTGRIVISANRNHERYAGFGFPVVSDTRTGYSGPLAGIEAALARVETDWALIVPCDVPGLPVDLVARLGASITDDRPAAVACSEGRRHAVLLCRRTVRIQVSELLDHDERRFGKLVEALAAAEVDFAVLPDGGSPFSNVNTPAELGNP